MKFWSQSIRDQEPIPSTYAFGKVDPISMIALGPNRSPHLAWSDVPKEAKSLAIISVDVDAPSKADDVNQKGREVPKDLARSDFYHLVLIDLPPSLKDLPEGALSEGVTARGKGSSLPAVSGRQGLNNYTEWFAGDPEMKGQYYGYDGPCPPWNDSIIHRYYFRLYALDLAKLPASEPLTGPAALKAMDGHILAEAAFMGTYTLNPKLK